MKNHNHQLLHLFVILLIPVLGIPPGSIQSAEKNTFALPRIPPMGAFTHGVASGDPGKNRVILWTRYLPQDSSSTPLTYELALKEDFSTILLKGETTTLPDHGFCVKVDVNGLKPGTTYYYRFSDGTIYSSIGRTKTLPEKADRIRIGVVNCAKYTGGYYHAYEALSHMEDIDVVIHLGDYIYEGGITTPKDSYYSSFLKTGRQHFPPHECLTLEDYRNRYAQYRSDPALQKLHAQFPMIAIWDDHEIAMKKHKKNKKGKKVPNASWEERRDHSIIAYHEWLPLRPDPFSEIYRSFQFGDLANLLMLRHQGLLPE